MANRFKLPSYRRAITSWVRYKVTGKGAALRQPIRTTFKARRYLRARYARGLPAHHI